MKFRSVTDVRLDNAIKTQQQLIEDLLELRENHNKLCEDVASLQGSMQKLNNLNIRQVAMVDDFRNKTIELSELVSRAMALFERIDERQ